MIYETEIEFGQTMLSVRIEFDYIPGRPAVRYPWPGEPAEDPDIELRGFEYGVGDGVFEPAGAGLHDMLIEAFGGEQTLTDMLVQWAGDQDLS